jgi:TolA-binding protein
MTPVALPAAVRDQTIPRRAPEIRPPSGHRTRMTSPHRRHENPLADEVELLQRAHDAYTSGDFSTTLVLVAEHSRRFPRGPLAEECEALRVKSLLGSGRRDDARRAGAAFATRYPRSVLLTRIEEALDGPEEGRPTRQ